MNLLQLNFTFLKRLTLFIIILLTASFSLTYADTKTVPVTRPDFKIQINQVDIRNDQREYPILLYNNTPYYPLTYSDCRHLGFEMFKNASDELQLNSTAISAHLQTNLSKKNHSLHGTATVATYPIRLNGNLIKADDLKKMPFLIYKNVPYMPLCNAFIQKELHLSCNWPSPDLLAVSSSNLVPKQLSLPGYRRGDLLISGQYAYYFDLKNRLIQCKLNANEKLKILMQLPTQDLYGSVKGSLRNDKGYSLLTYHTGGGFMGSDMSYIIQADGTLISAQCLLGDLFISTSTGVPPGGDNLNIKHKGEPFKCFGKSNYIYGWSWEQNPNRESGGPTNDLYRLGDTLYLLATDQTVHPNYSRICSVSLKDGAVTQLNDLPTNHFVLEDKILYTVVHKTLYKIPVHKEAPTEVSLKQELLDFQVLGGILYGVSTEGSTIICVTPEGTQTLQENATVTDFRLCNGYIVCTFEEKPSTPYRLMIFNKSGQIAYKTSDVISMGTLSIDHDVLYYVESKSHDVCKVQLLQKY